MRLLDEVYRGTFSIERIVSHAIQENTYLVYVGDAQECLAVDPFSFVDIMSWLEARQKNIGLILLTHEHYDHIGAVHDLVRVFDCDVVCMKACSMRLSSPEENLSCFFPLLATLSGYPNAGDGENALYECICATRSFDVREQLVWNKIPLDCIPTPGHTDSSACYLLDDTILFSGDTLLRDAKTTTKLPTGSWADFQDTTVPILAELQPKCLVLPGHGPEFLLGERIANGVLYPVDETMRRVKRWENDDGSVFISR